ncbi:Transposase [compost metagenome]
MKSGPCSEARIIRAIKEADDAREVADGCRELAITAQSMDNWRGKYGGMEVSQAKQVKQPEDENRRLKLSGRRACGLANLAKSVWQDKRKKAVFDASL